MRTTTGTIMCIEFLCSRSRVAILAGAIAIVPATVVPSRAADLVYGQGAQSGQGVQPPTSYPAASPTYLWNGTYLGIYGGYNSLNADLTNLPNISSVGGLITGGYLGYNHQLSDNWVTGLEGTLGISSASGNNSGITVDQDWEASLRARMGFAFENSMIYGLAGFAGSDVNASSATASDNNVLLGWQIGAGLETFLTDQITGRVEYDYTDYHGREFSLGASGSPNIDLGGHTIKLGVGFKF